MKRLSIVCVTIGIIMSIAATSAFSQATPPASESDMTQATAPVAAQQDKEIAIYGEVQAVNAIANTLSVQYYDYDSDSEKTAEVAIGADTKLENAKSASDMKKGDWVDVTYVVSGGKNMAKIVSVEREEPAAEPMAGASDAAATGASSDE